MSLEYNPDEWSNTNLSFGEAYEYKTDSGTFSGNSSETMFSLDFEHEPGEVWQIKLKLMISSELQNGDLILEVVKDPNSDYIETEYLGSYSGTVVETTFTVPTYVVNNDFSRPASSSARPEYSFQTLGSDSGNYWAYLEAVRLNPPIDNNSRYQGGGADSLSSGTLS